MLGYRCFGLWALYWHEGGLFGDNFLSLTSRDHSFCCLLLGIVLLFLGCARICWPVVFWKTHTLLFCECFWVQCSFSIYFFLHAFGIHTWSRVSLRNKWCIFMSDTLYSFSSWSSWHHRIVHSSPSVQSQQETAMSIYCLVLWRFNDTCPSKNLRYHLNCCCAYEMVVTCACEGEIGISLISTYLLGIGAILQQVRVGKIIASF